MRDQADRTRRSPPKRLNWAACFAALSVTGCGMSRQLAIMVTLTAVGVWACSDQAEPSSNDGSTSTTTTGAVQSPGYTDPGNTVSSTPSSGGTTAVDPAAPSTGGTGDDPVVAPTGGTGVAPVPTSTGVSSSTAGTEPSTAGPTGSSGNSVNPMPAQPAASGLGPFTCPAGPHAASPIDPAASVQKIEGVPPVDDFATDMDLTILEGPVWVDGYLYLSQINSGNPFGGFFPLPQPGVTSDATSTSETSSDSTAGQPPPSRILKVTEAGEVSVAFADAGSNGLALDAQGALVATNHAQGSVVTWRADGASMDLVSTFDGIRFNSPNDLTFGADGTLYFTDPDYQAPKPAPQATTRAYRVAPGTNTAIPIAEGRTQPNGITLSPDRTTIYISASDGLVAYPVLSDGNLGAGTPFATDNVRQSDGMAVDCAGNLYTTANQTVTIVNPSGQHVGNITVSNVQTVTNVAFGDADRQTLYITTLGTGSRVGLFKVRVSIPGMPY